MSGDTLMAIVCALAVGVMLLISEAAGHFLKAPARTTRLTVHVASGTIAALAPLLFNERWWPAAVAALALIAIIFSQRRQWLPALHKARPSSLGTVWFALSTLGLFLFAWNEPVLITIPLLVMAFADAAGVVVGEFRQNTIPLPSEFDGKTWDGSVGVFALTGLTVSLCWEALGLGPTGEALLVGLACAPIVTAVEALSRNGFDNLTVPVATVVTVVLIQTTTKQPQSLLITETLAIAFMAGAVKWRALTPGGAAGAFVIAAWLCGGGGITWTLPILVFFILSSGLSRIQTHNRKKAVSLMAKGYQRDLAQVLANGAVATAFFLGHLLGLPASIAWTGMLGAVASATADTWATEIGTGFRSDARLITTGRLVPAGTSGGVTFIGSVGSLLGSLVIGGTALLLSPVEGTLVLKCAVAGISGGLLGAFTDSLLGATIQARFRCERCDRLTEKRIHCNGAPATRVTGWRVVDNDVVNALSGLMGAGVAVALLLLLR
ncbi:DUF92 domain-containing protein [Candidatus Zixiibacteriota bacterium]